ncbi:MAG: Abi family protein [Chitinivibrionia bacterium]|nr:Abi family protein [Chitinivibrionia bacterium]
MTKQYAKPPKTLDEQIDILISRGVVVKNREFARKILLEVNYYRFCGYGLSFELFDSDGNRQDKFKNGTTFEQICELHKWDVQLRDLLFGALSWFEIALRSILNYEMSTASQNPFWYLDFNLINNQDISAHILNYCKKEKTEYSNGNRKKEVFLQSYWTKYQNDEIPCWILTEVLPFGVWSKLLNSLIDTNAVKKISQHFSVPPNYLISWVHSLYMLRNKCSHHNQLWNRTFGINPMKTNKLKKLKFPEYRLGIVLYILIDVMQNDKERQKMFVDKLNDLLKNCPLDFHKPLGIPQGNLSI